MVIDVDSEVFDGIGSVNKKIIDAEFVRVFGGLVYEKYYRCFRWIHHKPPLV